MTITKVVIIIALYHLVMNLIEKGLKKLIEILEPYAERSKDD